MKRCLFKREIDGWASWGRVFQCIEAFEPLIADIFVRHGLTYETISNLTPGTNAVFLAGAYVVKIFAPAQSGIIPDTAELSGIRHALDVGVAAPKIICHGVINDRYDFPYLVMEHIEGIEAGDKIHALPGGEKQAFAAAIRALTDKLNVPYKGTGIADNVAENARVNTRWDVFPPALKSEVMEKASALSSDSFVYVHGDLTGENVLITEDGGIRVIDFGDSHIAPASYEWPPLILELFRCDPILIRAFLGREPDNDMIETLTQAVMIHDFGAGFVRDLCHRTGAKYETVLTSGNIAAMMRRVLAVQ
ncbi:MAG: aminoglycoside phosphotransferase family protein [Oscillospiraceae bacterium]|jgi:serine/threonine protein kinase|nr:aminoglycoside phosphotransferase family protein [Oscillospiraceae bacterium]